MNLGRTPQLPRCTKPPLRLRQRLLRRSLLRPKTTSSSDANSSRYLDSKRRMNWNRPTSRRHRRAAPLHPCPSRRLHHLLTRVPTWTPNSGDRSSSCFDNKRRQMKRNLRSSIRLRWNPPLPHHLPHKLCRLHPSKPIRTPNSGDRSSSCFDNRRRQMKRNLR